MTEPIAHPVGVHFGLPEAQYHADPALGSSDIRTLLQNHILIAREDVILTPHNAFNSKEAVRAIFDTTVGNIKAFIDGNPANVVGK